MKKTFAIFSIFIFVASCTPQYKAQETIVQSKSIVTKRPKNIILMIGDGMGLTQVSAGYYMNSGKLNLEQFPFVGLHINYPAEDSTIITDSAAGATAFSIGEKTYNGAIGVGKDSLPRETIMETAKKKGLATGLVVTCNIQHATPASFIAHVKSRADYEPISLDILNSNIDFFIGGGKKYFDSRKMDNRNLLTEMENKGYQISDWIKEDIDKVKINKDKFIYLTANDQPLTAEQGRDCLPKASKMACNFLENRSNKGFFMMTLRGLAWDTDMDSLYTATRNMIIIKTGKNDFYLKENFYTVRDDFMYVSYQVNCNEDLAKNIQKIPTAVTDWRPHVNRGDTIRVVAIGVNETRYYKLMGM